MPEPRLVVDASFVAWTVHEPGAMEPTERIEFRMTVGQTGMMAPALMPFELGNALRKRWLSADLDQRILLHSELIAGVRIIATEALDLNEVHRLAEKYDLTFYDAAYLHTAAAGPHRTLVTQDRRLRAAGAKALGPSRALDGEELADRFRRGVPLA